MLIYLAGTSHDARGRQSSEDENFIMGYSDVNAGDKLYSSESEKSAAATGAKGHHRAVVKIHSSETESGKAANPYDEDLSGPANELENEDDFWN